MPVRTWVNGRRAVSGKLLIASDAAMCTIRKRSPSFAAAATTRLKSAICRGVNGFFGS